MAPRLRPEVIIPLRTGGSWARTMLLGCCAFIMMVTTVDAMRYAAHRNARAREAALERDMARYYQMAREQKLTKRARLNCRVATCLASPEQAPEPR